MGLIPGPHVSTSNTTAHLGINFLCLSESALGKATTEQQGPRGSGVRDIGGTVGGSGLWVRIEGC